MQEQTRRIPADRERGLQRALVAQTLREDRTDGWALAQLAAELGETDAPALGEAVARLEEADVVEILGETVRAARATRWLDALEMIAL